MRLLRVDKEELTFEHAPSHGPFPAYAILSHTWILPTESQPYPEVSIQDLKHADQTLATDKPGWPKIRNFIKCAQQENIDLVWIDTCCIDQQNPTELTEAINCMFRWYQHAKLCCAFLDDYPRVEFSKTRWMRRGFTLQELIAPSAMRFYDGEWQHLYTREDCAEELASATGIDVHILTSKDPTIALKTYSIAKRMSWAARRETSRPEDRAYSLFGLFDIIMPTHYGEGEQRAFARLQEEIVKVSADQSIFAWDVPAGERNPGLLFAPSPRYFEGRGHIQQSLASVPVEYHMNNRGLEISIQGFRTHPTTRSPSSGKYQAILDCQSANNPSAAFILNLYPTGQGVYCMSPRSALRCEPIDWLFLQQSQGMTIFARRKITITRDADLSRLEEDDGPKYPKIRFQLLGPDGHEHVALPYPFPWISETLHLQPQSSGGLGARITFRWVDSRQAERMTCLVIALACDALGSVEPAIVHDPFDTGTGMFVWVPALHVVVDREIAVNLGAERKDDELSTAETTSFVDACSAVGSMGRFREDPLLYSLPIVRTKWIDRHTSLQVKLDQADVMGERMWVVQVNLLHATSIIPRVRSLIRTYIVHPVAFLLIGWDIRRSRTDDDSLSPTIMPQDRGPLLVKAAVMAYTFGFNNKEPSNTLKTLLIYTSSLHTFIFKNGWDFNRTLFKFFSATPRALVGADASIYQHISSVAGSTRMYRQWELMAYVFYFLSVWNSDIPWRKALSDFLRVTLWRDCFLISNLSNTGSRMGRMAACFVVARIVDGSWNSHMAKLQSFAPIILSLSMWNLLQITCAASITIGWMWRRDLLRQNLELLAILVTIAASLIIIPLYMLRNRIHILAIELKMPELLAPVLRRSKSTTAIRWLWSKVLPPVDWTLQRLDLWHTWALTPLLHLTEGYGLRILVLALLWGTICAILVARDTAVSMIDQMETRIEADHEHYTRVRSMIDPINGEDVSVASVRQRAS